MIDITTIADRLSWVAYRADWRLRYKQASDDVRACKREIAGHRALRRELGQAGDEHRHKADGLQCGLWSLRRDASRLMVELDKAKEHKVKLMTAKAEETQLAA